MVRDGAGGELRDYWRVARDMSTVSAGKVFIHRHALCFILNFWGWMVGFRWGCCEA